MLPRALEGIVTWSRSIEEVVAIFSDFKGERCSN